MSLPVVDGRPGTPGRIRMSRVGKWRAIVLGLIQLAIIAHIVQWLVTGTTLTPVEPSEATETIRYGVINAGVILLVVALASTAVLGRWFCGWACHVVMLQDLCGWFMKKLGVRPRPFRTRFLILIPTLLAIYMFGWPILDRLLRAESPSTALPPWRATMHLTTQDFWATFPGVAIAVPFLLICGFGCVYFLGAKGYCTYGCPYGGLFAPLDQFARGRIRVNDDCEHCGHCTAVCTSNVRVHEEVRAYGMVVDPGCMKCLDCVSVCPNEALSFGFGPPARRAELRDTKPRSNFDLSFREEWILLGIYLASMLVLYGLYGLVPYLMASGMSAIVTYLAWKLWRISRDPSVNLHRYRLRYKGRLTWAGRVFVSLTCLIMVFVLHSAAVRVVLLMADAAGEAADVRLPELLADDVALTANHRARLDRAIGLYELAAPVSRGGLALLQQPDLDITLAWLHLRRGDLETAAELFEAHITVHPSNRQAVLYLGLTHERLARPEKAIETLTRGVRDHPTWFDVADEAVRLLRDAGRVEEATEIRRVVYEANPGDAYAVRRYATALLDVGEVVEGRRLLRLSLDIQPRDTTANFIMARQLAGDGRFDEALPYAETALQGAPDLAQVRRLLANILRSLGREEEAAAYE